MPTRYFLLRLLLAIQLLAPTLRSQDQTEALILRDRLESLTKYSKEVSDRQKILRDDKTLTPENQARLTDELKQIQTSLHSAETEFKRLATGVPEITSTSGPEDVDLEKQFKQVVRPALDFMNDLMKQPREIDELRRSIGTRDSQIPHLQRALEGLKKNTTTVEAARKTNKDDKSYDKLHQDLQDLKKDTESRLNLVTSERSQLQQRLTDTLTHQKSFGQYAASLWSGYVLKRLLNLVLAVLAFLGVLFLLRWIHRTVGRRGLRKRLGVPIFLGRSIDVIYYLLSALAALGAAFVILWASGDWLLLTLAMLIVAGLALLSRNSLPRLYDQVRIMLNLGAIREGERVLWNNLPWLVRRLHIMCELHNPALTGGTIRLPLRKVDTLISRPYHSKERWFPVNEGEWVELNDGTVGKVVLQTPESVQIVSVGGCFRTYTVLDFLNRSPRNLSHNFRLQTRIGLDYRHAHIAQNDIPAILKSALEQALTKQLGADALINLRVELVEAGGSALQFAVIADLAGSAAPSYTNIPGLLQRTCVQTCLEQEWILPYRQVVIHQAPPAST